MDQQSVNTLLAVVALALGGGTVVLYALNYVGVRTAVPMLGLGLSAIALAEIPFSRRA